MNSKGKSNLGAIIIGAIILLIIIFWVSGHGSKTIPVIDKLSERDCNESIAKFENEYGKYLKTTAYFLDGTNFWILTFKNGWTTAVDSKNCKIVENESDLLKRFQIESFDEKISEMELKFYENTTDCPQITIAKGAENACSVVVPVNNVLDSTVSEIVSIIPSKDIQKYIGIVSADEWVIEKTVIAGSNAIKFLKSSQNISIGLTIVEAASCPLSKAPNNAIFKFSDAGNQLFQKAKNRQYTGLSIPLMYSMNDSIIFFEKASLTFPAGSDDLLGSIVGPILNEIIDGGSALISPSCQPTAQIKKYQDFQEQISSTFEIAKINDENSLKKLNELKTRATDAMKFESETKIMHYPNLIQWLIIQKAIEYQFSNSDAQKNFDDQLYESSKNSAFEQAHKFENFWDEITLADIGLALIVWICFIVFGYFLIKYIKSKLSN